MVSIIIPVFNAEMYLRECLDSVTRQTFEDIEILCIDDGSEDNSLHILNEYRQRDNRIRLYINEINRGQAATRNIGLENATGEFVIFVDSDDVLRLDAIQRLMMQKKNYDMISFDYRLFGELINKKNPESDFRKKEYPDVLSGVDSFVTQNQNNDIKIGACQYFYSASFLKKNDLRFHEGIYHEDLMFVFQTYLAADTVKIINEDLYSYRLRKESTMHKMEYQNKRVLSLLYIYTQSIDMVKNIEEYNGKVIDYHLQNTVRRIKDIIRNLNLGQIEEIKGLIQDIYQRNLFTVLCEEEKGILLSESEILELKKSRIVCLYGAGVYAQKWMSVIAQNNINLECILVSQKSENNIFFGYPIYTFDDYMKECEENISVIMGVSEIYKKEIREQLLRYNNIKIIDKDIV